MTARRIALCNVKRHTIALQQPTYYSRSRAMTTASPRHSLLKRARKTIDECLPSYRQTWPPEYPCDELNIKIGAAFFHMSSIKHIKPCAELSNEEEEDMEYIVVKLLVGPISKPWIAPTAKRILVRASKTH